MVNMAMVLTLMMLKIFFSVSFLVMYCLRHYNISAGLDYTIWNVRHLPGGPSHLRVNIIVFLGPYTYLAH